MPVLRIDIRLFLGLVWWMAIASVAQEYSCKMPGIPVKFTLCESYDGLDHIDQVGCDFFCMLLPDTVKNYLSEIDVAVTFENFCQTAKPKQLLRAMAVDADKQLGYAEFVVLVGTLTPACLRESLILFEDIVTVNPHKITEMDIMTLKDLTEWLLSVARAGAEADADEPEVQFSITREVFQNYWKNKIRERINKEKIKCSRTDFPPGSAENPPVLN